MEAISTAVTRQENNAVKKAYNELFITQICAASVEKFRKILSSTDKKEFFRPQTVLDHLPDEQPIIQLFKSLDIFESDMINYLDSNQTEQASAVEQLFQCGVQKIELFMQTFSNDEIKDQTSLAEQISKLSKSSLYGKYNYAQLKQTSNETTANIFADVKMNNTKLGSIYAYLREEDEERLEPDDLKMVKQNLERCELHAAKEIEGTINQYLANKEQHVKEI